MVFHSLRLRKFYVTIVLVSAKKNPPLVWKKLRILGFINRLNMTPYKVPNISCFLDVKSIRGHEFCSHNYCQLFPWASTQFIMVNYWPTSFDKRREWDTKILSRIQSLELLWKVKPYAVVFLWFLGSTLLKCTLGYWPLLFPSCMEVDSNFGVVSLIFLTRPFYQTMIDNCKRCLTFSLCIWIKILLLVAGVYFLGCS